MTTAAPSRRLAVVTAAVLTLPLTGLVSLVITLVNLGAYGLPYWPVNWVLAWITAFPCAVLLLPMARRVAARLVGVAIAAMAVASGMAQAQPAPIPRTAEARRAELDRAFDALRTAPDAAGAQFVEGRIRALWAADASPAAVLLLRRGARNLEAGLAGEAVDDLDAALTLAPDYAEGWALRAQAHARAGAAAAAAGDLREALRLEPRHWPTLLTLAQLLEDGGDADAAVRSVAAALAIHPHLAGGAERLRELRRKAEGDAL